MRELSKRVVGVKQTRRAIQEGRAARVYLAADADPLITDVLGEHVTRQYVTGKLKEWEEYPTRVSSWELEKYLVTY